MRTTMEYLPVDSADKDLIEAAAEVIRKNYNAEKHSVGAAVLCASGQTYVGINIDSCGYGPCAEPIALGAAISSSEREFKTIVAVEGEKNTVISPCGNCRQMLIDFAPDAMVIVTHEGKPVKVRARDLLPDSFGLFDKI